MSDGERIIGEGVSIEYDNTTDPTPTGAAPRDEAREAVRREMLDALLAASRHCQVPNGTTGALDLLARYDAALLSRVGHLEAALRAIAVGRISEDDVASASMSGLLTAARLTGIACAALAARAPGREP